MYKEDEMRFDALEAVMIEWADKQAADRRPDELSNQHHNALWNDWQLKINELTMQANALLKPSGAEFTRLESDIAGRPVLTWLLTLEEHKGSGRARHLTFEIEPRTASLQVTSAGHSALIEVDDASTFPEDAVKLAIAQFVRDYLLPRT